MMNVVMNESHCQIILSWGLGFGRKRMTGCLHQVIQKAVASILLRPGWIK